MKAEPETAQGACFWNDRVTALQAAFESMPQRDARWKETLDALTYARVQADFAAGDLRGALLWAGKNGAPAYLVHWWREGRIGREQLRANLLDVWCLAEFPCLYLPRKLWLEWFELAGFVSDGGQQPTKPLEIWRAQFGRTLGLSWTTDANKARWFHRRNVKFFDRAGRLLRGIVQPAGVLAFCDARNEHEVIVHPRRVRYTEVTRV